MSDQVGLEHYEWRVCDKTPRTIYAMRGYDRDKDDYVGQMLTPALSATVVAEHNRALRQEA